MIAIPARARLTLPPRRSALGASGPTGLAAALAALFALGALILGAGPGASLATADGRAAHAASHAPDWSTRDGSVVCGLADVRGTWIDPGTGVPENGRWPGLQCSASGIPRPPGRVGDPFVQLGQGRAGRARLVDLSQDDLLVDAAPKRLAPGSTWARAGIRCAVRASSIACHNASGHGFSMSTGHVHLH